MDDTKPHEIKWREWWKSKYKPDNNGIDMELIRNATTDYENGQITAGELRSFLRCAVGDMDEDGLLVGSFC